MYCSDGMEFGASIILSKTAHLNTVHWNSQNRFESGQTDIEVSLHLILMYWSKYYFLILILNIIFNKSIKIIEKLKFSRITKQN